MDMAPERGIKELEEAVNHLLAKYYMIKYNAAHRFPEEGILEGPREGLIKYLQERLKDIKISL